MECYFFSLERDQTELTVRTRDFCTQMGRWWNFVFDATWPHLAYFSGHAFNSVIEKFFKDFDVTVTFWIFREPLWFKYDIEQLLNSGVRIVLLYHSVDL